MTRVTKRSPRTTKTLCDAVSEDRREKTRSTTHRDYMDGAYRKREPLFRREDAVYVPPEPRIVYEPSAIQRPPALNAVADTASVMSQESSSFCPDPVNMSSRSKALHRLYAVTESERVVRAARMQEPKGDTVPGEDTAATKKPAHRRESMRSDTHAGHVTFGSDASAELRDTISDNAGSGQVPFSSKVASGNVRRSGATPSFSSPSAPRNSSSSPASVAASSFHDSTPWHTQSTARYDVQATGPPSAHVRHASRPYSSQGAPVVYAAYPPSREDGRCVNDDRPRYEDTYGTTWDPRHHAVDTLSPPREHLASMRPHVPDGEIPEQQARQPHTHLSPPARPFPRGQDVTRSVIEQAVAQLDTYLQVAPADLAPADIRYAVVRGPNRTPMIALLRQESKHWLSGVGVRACDSVVSESEQSCAEGNNGRENEVPHARAWEHTHIQKTPYAHGRDDDKDRCAYYGVEPRRDSQEEIVWKNPRSPGTMICEAGKERVYRQHMEDARNENARGDDQRITERIPFSQSPVHCDERKTAEDVSFKARITNNAQKPSEEASQSNRLRGESFSTNESSDTGEQMFPQSPNVRWRRTVMTALEDFAEHSIGTSESTAYGVRARAGSGARPSVFGLGNDSPQSNLDQHMQDLVDMMSNASTAASEISPEDRDRIMGDPDILHELPVSVLKKKVSKLPGGYRSVSPADAMPSSTSRDRTSDASYIPQPTAIPKLNRKSVLGLITFRQKCQVAKEDFETPVRRDVSAGGTASFFDLFFVPQRVPRGKERDAFIGKDLAHAQDEIDFYHTLKEICETNKTWENFANRFCLFSPGVLSLPCRQADGPPVDRSLLLLENLKSGMNCFRFLDVKIGFTTALPGWKGKSHLRAWKNRRIDMNTNTNSEGSRIEGVVNCGQLFESHLNAVTKEGKLSIILSEKKMKKFALQNITIGQSLPMFFDLRQDGKQLFRHSEKYIHRVLIRMWTELCHLCSILDQIVPPQQWLGSSIALAFDCNPTSVDRPVMVTRLFDWGRSALETMDEHLELSEVEQLDREKYWTEYYQAMLRLCWEVGRYTYHRALSPAWRSVIFEFETAWDSKVRLMGYVKDLTATRSRKVPLYGPHDATKSQRTSRASLEMTISIAIEGGDYEITLLEAQIAQLGHRLSKNPKRPALLVYCVAFERESDAEKYFEVTSKATTKSPTTTLLGHAYSHPSRLLNATGSLLKGPETFYLSTSTLKIEDLDMPSPPLFDTRELRPDVRFANFSSYSQSNNTGRIPHGLRRIQKQKRSFMHSQSAPMSVP